MSCCRERVAQFRPEDKERWQRYWNVLTGGEDNKRSALSACETKLRDAKWLREKPISWCKALQRFLSLP